MRKEGRRGKMRMLIGKTDVSLLFFASSTDNLSSIRSHANEGYGLFYL